MTNFSEIQDNKYFRYDFENKGNKWSVLLSWGKYNYVSVTKKTNNPFGTPFGKEFKSIGDAVDNYKDANIQANILFAGNEAKKYGYTPKYSLGGEIDFSDYSNDALTEAIINLSRYENTQELIQILKEELAKRKDNKNEFSKGGGVGSIKFEELVGNKFSIKRGSGTKTTTWEKEDLLQEIKQVIIHELFDRDFYYNWTDKGAEYYNVFDKYTLTPMLKDIDKTLNEYFVMKKTPYDNVLEFKEHSKIKSIKELGQGYIDNWFKTNPHISPMLRNDYKKYREKYAGVTPYAKGGGLKEFPPKGELTNKDRKFQNGGDVDEMPNEIIGNDNIKYIKVKTHKNPNGKIVVNYEGYWNGYIVDGFWVDNNIKELNRYVENIILSTNQYNRLKHLPIKELPKYKNGGSLSNIQLNDWVTDKKGGARGQVYWIEGNFVKLKDKYGNLDNKMYFLDNLKQSSKPRFAEGGNTDSEKNYIKILHDTIRNISEKMEVYGESGYGGNVVYSSNRNEKLNIYNYKDLQPYSSQALEPVETKVSFMAPNKTAIIFDNLVKQKFEDRKSYEKYKGLIYIYEPLTNEIAKEILEKLFENKKFAEGGKLKRYPNLSEIKPTMVTEPEKKKNKFALGGSIEQTGLFDNYTPVKPTIISKKPKKEQGILENQISEVDVVRLGVTTLPSEKNKKIMSSNDAVKILYDVFPKEQIAVQEFYYVLFLNNNNSVIAYYNLSKGGVTSTIADIELIASAGVKLLAKGVIVAHNHPSGNLKPSDADINISKETRKALKLLGILLMDSIIIVPNGDLNGYKYTSLMDEGLI